MATTRRPRKKKAKKISFFKLSPKTKKRLVRLSVAVNIALIVFLFFAVKRDGLAVTFEHAGKFISAPFAHFKLPSIPALAHKKSSPSPSKAPKKVTPPAPIKTAPEAAAVPAVTKPIAVVRNLSSSKPKIIFVIDDMGHTLSHRDVLRSLGRDVTYAILPHLTYSRFYGLLSEETGAEVILHQPFEARDGTIPGPGLITDRMSKDQALNVLRRSLDSIPNHQGVNNHMGSRGTSNRELMLPILRELKQANLFFLDSMTSSKSVGISIARQIGLPAVRRDVFLDNVDDVTSIQAQVRKTAAIARDKGYAIAIGHYHPKTLQVLSEEIPKLKAAGFELVSLAEIIRYLQRKNAL